MQCMCSISITLHFLHYYYYLILFCFVFFFSVIIISAICHSQLMYFNVIPYILCVDYFNMDMKFTCTFANAKRQPRV